MSESDDGGVQPDPGRITTREDSAGETIITTIQPEEGTAKRGETPIVSIEPLDEAATPQGESD